MYRHGKERERERPRVLWSTRHCKEMQAWRDIKKRVRRRKWSRLTSFRRNYTGNNPNIINLVFDATFAAAASAVSVLDIMRQQETTFYSIHIFGWKLIGFQFRLIEETQNMGQNWILLYILLTLGFSLSLFLSHAHILQIVAKLKRHFRKWYGEDKHIQGDCER